MSMPVEPVIFKERFAPNERPVVNKMHKRIMSGFLAFTYLPWIDVIIVGL